MKNIDLGKTQITEQVRVSSAAIFYKSPFFGDYYQFETFIFSEDKGVQKSRQIIHGTTWNINHNFLLQQTKKVHAYVSNNLTRKFNTTLN